MIIVSWARCDGGSAGAAQERPAPRLDTWHVLQCRTRLPVGLLPATASAGHR
jgi:hypothetical protein